MIDRRWYAVLAVILACSVTYFIGKKQGHLDEELTNNSLELKKSDSSIKSVQIRTDSAKRRSDVLDKNYDVVRTKVRVVHDTTFLPSDTPGKVDTVANSTLARLIFSADSMKTAHKEERAASDVLVASLRLGISLRDERIKLLESRGTSRISKGIQVGVGECLGPNGKTACGYVGYGLEIRVP